MPGLSVYFQILNPSAGLYDVDKFPAILTYPAYSPEKYRFILIFPSFEYPGMVKVSSTSTNTIDKTHDWCNHTSSIYTANIISQQLLWYDISKDNW